MSSVSTSICNYFDIDEYCFRKTFIPALIISLIYFLPFLILDEPFYDDYGWIMQSYSNSAAIGRLLIEPMLNLFSVMPSINTEYNLPDLHPGFQLLSILILVFSTSVLVVKVNGRKFSNVKYLWIVVFAFLANPLLTQTMMFHLVCLTMAAAYSLAIIASIQYKNKITNITIGSLYLILAFNLYQISLNLFIASTLLIFLFKFNENIKESFSFLAENAFKITLSLVIYKFLVLNYLGPDSYLDHHKTLISFDEHFAKHLLHGLFVFFHKLKLIIPGSKLITVFTAISLLAFIIHYVRENKNNRILAFSTLLVTTILILLCTPGFQMILEGPVYASRTFIGFSMFLVLIFYMFLNSVGKWLPKARVLMLVPLFYFFITSYSYGHIRLRVSEFNKFVMGSVMNTINNLNIQNTDKFYAIGELKPTHITSSYEKMNILGFLRVNHARPWFLSDYMKYHFNSDFNFWALSNKKRKQLCKAKVVYRNTYYKIARLNNDYLLAFEGCPCFNALR